MHNRMILDGLAGFYITEYVNCKCCFAMSTVGDGPNYLGGSFVEMNMQYLREETHSAQHAL